MRAAVAAQRETGAPLMIHPGRNPRAPMQILELVEKEGGNLKRTIMCHIERTIADRKHLMDLAQTGCYLEYDLFGLETSFYPYNPDFDMPNDGGRMSQILRLIEDGHGRQVLMSHDIAYKHCLTKWGGFGYHHLLRTWCRACAARAWTTARSAASSWTTPAAPSSSPENPLPSGERVG